MRFLPFLSVAAGLIACLSGCANSPAPQFWGAERHEITREGIRFVVYDIGSDVEVVRLGYLSMSERARVPRLMREVAEEVTGCTVAGPSGGPLKSPSLPGDTGEARFTMDCG